MDESRLDQHARLQQSTSNASKKKIIIVALVPAAIVIVVVCLAIIQDGIRKRQMALATNPPVILAYEILQYSNKPCLAVEKAALTYGPITNFAAGTFHEGPLLMAVTGSPSRPTVRIESWMLAELVRQNGPGTKFWIELVERRYAQLDAVSQSVVSGVRADFPGIEFRDPVEHSNWVPMPSEMAHRLQPTLGHSATECPDPKADRIMDATHAANSSTPGECPEGYSRVNGPVVVAGFADSDALTCEPVRNSETTTPSSDSAQNPAAPAPTSGEQFVVQIAAVSKKDDADALVGAARSRGYPAALIVDPNDHLFHVQVGPFGDRTSAAATSDRLVRDGYNSRIEVSIPPFLYPVSVRGKFGFIDPSGKIVIQPQLDDVASLTEPSFFAAGAGAVKVGSKWGFIRPDGSWLVRPTYEEAWNFEEGLAWVKIDSAWGCINTAGATVIQPRFDNWGGFTDGLSLMHDKSNDWIGFIDRTGRVVLPASRFGPHATGFSDFTEGRAAVAISSTVPTIGSSWHLIDKSGSFIGSATFHCLAPGRFVKGLAPTAAECGKAGFIDQQGRFVIPPRFQDTREFQEDMAAVQENGKWGFVDRSGNLVVPPQYKAVLGFSSGLSAALTEAGWGYIDKTGRVVIPPRFARAGYFRGPLAAVIPLSQRPDMAVSYIDAHGTVVWDSEAHAR